MTPEAEMEDPHSTLRRSSDDARFRLIENRLDEGSRRMGLFSEELTKNTEMTKDIRDILETAKLGIKVIGGLGTFVKWAGIIAGACVSIYAFFYTMTHGGKP